MNYTTGPWINRTMGDETDKNGGQIFSRKLHLATAHYGNGVDVAERKANSALISACPEMYEALQWASRFYQDNFEIMPVAFQGVIDSIDKALSKAEGRE